HAGPALHHVVRRLHEFAVFHGAPALRGHRRGDGPERRPDQDQLRLQPKLLRLRVSDPTVRDLRLPCFLDRAEHRHGFARGHADPRDEPLQRHRRHRRSRVRAGGREEPGDLRSGRRDRQRGQPRIFRGEQPAPELMRLASGKKKPGIAGFLFLVALGAATRNYIGWTWSACKPFWPCTTTKETCWPSFRLLKPCDWIARKCTNTSSPFSRLMKPKPLASLNHLTVPVSRFDICIAPSAVGRFAGVRRYSAAATYARIRENATGVKTPPPPRPNPRKEAPNESATDVRPGRPARRRRPGRRGAAGTAGLAAGLRRHADRG